MRPTISAVILLAPFVLVHAVDKKDTISSAKVSAEALKKEWCLKAVSAKPGHDSGQSTEVTIVVRFEKDLTKDALRDLQKSITPDTLNTITPVKAFFVDEDSVVVHKNRIRDIKGEITGKAGDAFRVITDCDDEVIAKVKRIELRHSQH